MNNQQKESQKSLIPDFHAAIFDMDGVITQTAKIHNEAWKKMFAEFFEKYNYDEKPVTDNDYLKYIDGKPRYDGVQSFLDSRSIEIPYGKPNDSTDKKTVCGLGNRKNKIFVELLKTKDVEVYDDTIEKIKAWKSQGIKTAVISSSKNCKLVLEKAGVLSLFDARVDGEVSDKLNLKGKPHPDIFITAAEKLDEQPKNCIVIEDAISGVQAGTRGNFALVVGVDRNNQNQELNENGADEVVTSLSQINLTTESDLSPWFEDHPPLLLDKKDYLQQIFGNKQPVLFFDYDGTLTPIVKDPAKANISEEMKDLLSACAKKFKVAVISGRDMDDLKSHVGLQNIIYAGSHGFRISGPDGFYHEHEKTAEIVPHLDELEKQLKDTFGDNYKGVQIERKRYAIAIHYRNATPEIEEKVKQKTDEFINRVSNIKKGLGKKIIELKPDIDWHKGKAVNWILKESGWDDNSKYYPVYIGDDVTDEDAFEAFQKNGLGLIVGHHENKSAAHYKLKNIYQVKLFLQNLLKNY